MNGKRNVLMISIKNRPCLLWSLIWILTIFCLVTKCESAMPSSDSASRFSRGNGQNLFIGGAGFSCSNCQYFCDKEGKCQGDCVEGFYGEFCDQTCDVEACQACDKSTGTCVSCKPMLYGDSCQLNCDNKCWACNITTGDCLSCKDGWYGTFCNISCPENCGDRCDKCQGQCDVCKDSFWGPYCNKTCPVHCTHSCNQDIGICDACEPGFTGEKCDWKCSLKNCFTCSIVMNKEVCNVCDNGWYGRNCDKQCPEHCNNGTCTMFHGSCDCDTGWYGDDCSQKCPTLCEECIDNSTCTKCQPGLYGLLCNKLCPESENCHECDIVTGVCTSCLRPQSYGPTCICNLDQCTYHSSEGLCLGCKKESWYTVGQGCCPCNDGCWSGTCVSTTGICTNGCYNGYYDETCDKSCSSHCNNKTVICNKENGHCPPYNGSELCEPDWYLPTCNFSCSANFPHCSSCAVSISDQTTVQCTNCSQGYFLQGSTCKPCSHCKDNMCDPITRRCLTGCKTGRYSPHSDQTCGMICSESCNNSSCDPESGNCTYGCKKGYFGKSCSILCPVNCKDGTCDPVTGNCLHGCNTGFSGNVCFSPCSDGCLKRECYMNGTCIKCASDRYGDDCSIGCFGCIDENCGQDGGCLNSCLPGFWGKYCENECNNPDHCYACDKESGQCLLCKTGFKAPFNFVHNGNCSQNCSEELKHSNCTNPWDNHPFDVKHPCDQGHYGVNCSFNCSEACQGPGEQDDQGQGYCDKYTGSCLKGCLPGFYGMLCDEKCSNCEAAICQRNGFCQGGCRPGYYTDTCTQQCPENCNFSTSCQQNNGFCSHGCKMGHHGDKCQMLCSSNCLGNQCNQSSGLCTKGCIEGFHGKDCKEKTPEHAGLHLTTGQTVGIVFGAIGGLILIGVVVKLISKRRATASGLITSEPST